MRLASLAMVCTLRLSSLLLASSSIASEVGGVIVLVLEESVDGSPDATAGVDSDATVGAGWVSF